MPSPRSSAPECQCLSPAPVSINHLHIIAPLQTTILHYSWEHIWKLQSQAVPG
jgi:hypothetical protein